MSYTTTSRGKMQITSHEYVFHNISKNSSCRYQFSTKNGISQFRITSTAKWSVENKHNVDFLELNKYLTFVKFRFVIEKIFIIGAIQHTHKRYGNGGAYTA